LIGALNVEGVGVRAAIETVGAVANGYDEGVLPRLAALPVIAPTAFELIVTIAAKEAIVVGASVKLVVSVAALEQIPAGTSEELVIAVIADQPVVAVPAGDDIIPAARSNDVIVFRANENVILIRGRSRTAANAKYRHDASSFDGHACARDQRVRRSNISTSEKGGRAHTPAVIRVRLYRRRRQRTDE
jgi:hypothetical protein